MCSLHRSEMERLRAHFSDESSIREVESSLSSDESVNVEKIIQSPCLMYLVAHLTNPELGVMIV